jgi:16S rRNA (cytidine1402-2'-O)-methyltransferase
VARELTKMFEEVRRGTLDELAAAAAAEERPKGEIVVLVGPPLDEGVGAGELDARLAAALAEADSLKDAVKRVQAETGLPRRAVYARALELSGPPGRGSGGDTGRGGAGGADD